MKRYSTSQVSLNPEVAEQYIPLWFSDTKTLTYSSGTSTAGGFLNNGSTSTVNNGATCYLFSPSQNWSSQNVNIALEVSMSTSSASYPSYVALYDFNTSSIVSASQISTTSTSITSIRSGMLNLSSGHNYGVMFWNPSGYVTTIVDASIVVLGQ